MKYFSNILQRSLDLIYKNFSKLNILSIIALSLIIYRFIRGLSFDIGLLSLILSFIISFAISSFVLDKFTYSENMYIRFIQRFLIYVLIFIMGSFAFFYISKFFGLDYIIYNSGDQKDMETGNQKLVEITSNKDEDTDKDMYSIKISKELVDKGLKNIGTVAQLAAEKLVGNVGIGAAAGTKVGVAVGESVAKNIQMAKAIKNSQHADPQLDRIPSPDPNIINSPLENDITSPLQDLLLYSFILDILILILLIGILLIIFNRYIVKYNLTFINYIINKYMPIKIRNWFNINNGIDFSNKFVLFIFIINTILLFFFVFLKLLISSTLLVNIDSYINVHEFIHGGGQESSILLFTATTTTQALNPLSPYTAVLKYFRYLSTIRYNKDFNNNNPALRKPSPVKLIKLSLVPFPFIYTMGSGWNNGLLIF